MMWSRNKRVGALTLVPALLLISATAGAACVVAPPRVMPSTYSFSADGKTTFVVVPEGQHPKSSPYKEAPGSNHLPTVYENVCNSKGEEIPNTLPSTPSNPYNLHPDPVISQINKVSPTDDLTSAFKRIESSLAKGGAPDSASIKLALDILEGNPVPDRVYSGMPLLHYNGPNKIKWVEPICQGNIPCERNAPVPPATRGALKDPSLVIGGNVDIHQVWFDNHIESDAAMANPSEVLNVPWTITYTVDTLNRGHEDFAPMTMYFDDPSQTLPPIPGVTTGPTPMPHVNMDQTFFPMEDGSRTVYKIAMAPGKYWNLSYHWGWRMHPPRVQVTENARKGVDGKSLPQHEIDVFGVNPMGSRDAQLAAINMIGDLAPAKRMWSALRGMQANTGDPKKLLAEIKRAYFQWQDRTNLPDGVKQDPNSDMTLFYVNNTIYGHMKDMAVGALNQAAFPQWQTRGTHYKVHMINGDYFEHAYFNVDFGGSRGWENTFQSTVPFGGSGPWFTFGRNFWNVNAGAPIALDTSGKMISGVIKTAPATRPALGKSVLKENYTLADGVVLGEHNVDLLLNFDPSRRLRLYQFDPFHHDVAIWSIH